MPTGLENMIKKELAGYSRVPGSSDQKTDSGRFGLHPRDDNDCDGIIPLGGEKDHREAYFQSIDFVNVLYERSLTQGSERNNLPHVPYMFDIEIIKG